jgi:hypothetical protein
MALDLDFSEDYLVWDKTETVTLRTQTDPGFYEQLWDLTALRGQPSQKERAPTAGVYTGFDLLWCVPGRLLPVDVVPRPADIVRDGTETDWTVLSLDHDRLDDVWQLYSVNLVLAHGLKDTVTVWAPGTSQDAAGSRKPSFSASSGSYAARIQLVNEEPTEERGKRLHKRSYEIYLAAEVAGLTHEWQIRDAAGTVYQVTRYRNRSRIDELSVVECQNDTD